MNEPDNPEPEHLCRNCKYRGADASYEDRNDDVTGPTCRRHAPLVTGGMMSPKQTVWPIVKLDEWCGDFEHRY